MRFFILAAIALLPATSAAAPGGSQAATPKALRDLGLTGEDCPPTAAQQVARQVRESQPPLFHRLVTLPPATAYATVVREVDGCEAPLTMIEYRNAIRR